MNRLEMINELAKHPEKKFKHGAVTISRRQNGLYFRDKLGGEGCLDTEIFENVTGYEEIKEEKVNIIIEDMIKKLKEMKVK